MSTEREPGFYWVQYKPYDQMTLGYFCGTYDGYERWCIGPGRYISWREIYKIGDEKIKRPEALSPNPDYLPLDIKY
jgi:hypothetical protein